MSFETACPSGNIMIDGYPTMSRSEEKKPEPCSHCDGEGQVKVTRKEFNDHVMAHAFELSNDKTRHIAIKNKWKRTGEIVCPECYGSGNRRG